MSRDLLDLVRKLNTLNDDDLADRVIENSDVQWCLSELQGILEEMPIPTPPNEWVSVEERLPEPGKDVLLYFGEESRISVGGRYDVGDGWYAVIVNEYETICDTSPRSWMPLPAPPDRRPPERQKNA